MQNYFNGPHQVLEHNRSHLINSIASGQLKTVVDHITSYVSGKRKLIPVMNTTKTDSIINQHD